MFSVSQTVDEWYNITYVSLTYSVLYTLFSAVKLYTRYRANLSRTGEVMNIVTAVSMFGSLLWLLLVDQAPPDAFDELIKAFMADTTEQYFIVMSIINDCRVFCGLQVCTWHFVHLL